MNRQDFQTVLGQVDNVGDTLMRNRMNAEAKQERTADRDLRERMFTEQQATRKELQTQNAAWKTQSQDQQQLQTIIKANADGSLDDASRERANQWISTHPQLSATGIQLVKPMPKTPGTMETSQTRNHAELKKLQDQIRTATTPEAKAAAEQDLADFKSLLPGRPDGIKPEKTPDDMALDVAQRRRAEAVADNKPDEVERLDLLADRLSGKLFKPVAGEVRKRDEELMQGGQPAQPPAAPVPQQPQAAGTNAPAGAGPKAVNVEAIMAEANRAIQAGAPRDAVLKELQEKYGITVK